MRRLAASLPRAFVAARNGHVEGGPVGHPRAVSVFDGPILHVLVVEEAHGVVVADARPAPRVPVLGDREDGARLAVGERVA